ncbi:MAG TPA: T9SS type A sorting domain-containing protein [Chitinophagales bacterium]|nr:T9SS type A sorting domain-containing protein [Chitinophagales bacterium]
MKKFTLLFSITLLALLSFHQLTFAQAQRLILVEEFTQASCPPCGQQNPGFNALLNNNTEKVRSLKYQVSWPGYDPMNLQNPSQVAVRVSYYGVNAVPWGFVDGSSIANDCGYWLGAPVCLSQSDINAEYAIPSSFSMSVSYYLSNGNDSIYVILNIKALASVSGLFKARIAVVEKEIDFSTEPGTNGETVFENVMKRMLPGTLGTVLPATMDSGYTTTILTSWKLANIYDINQLAVIAFIQNDADKAIYQAAYSGSVVGIASPETSAMKLYPNPVDGEAVVQVSGIVSNQTKLEVVDVLGQVIYSAGAKSNSNLTINTSQFERGMYIYRLNDNGKIIAQDKFNVSR